MPVMATPCLHGIQPALRIVLTVTSRRRGPEALPAVSNAATPPRAADRSLTCDAGHGGGPIKVVTDTEHRNVDLRLVVREVPQIVARLEVGLVQAHEGHGEVAAGLDALPYVAWTRNAHPQATRNPAGTCTIKGLRSPPACHTSLSQTSWLPSDGTAGAAFALNDTSTPDTSPTVESLLEASSSGDSASKSTRQRTPCQSSTLWSRALGGGLESYSCPPASP
jgi:hypothetical protein